LAVAAQTEKTRSFASIAVNAHAHQKRWEFIPLFSDRSL